MEQMLTIRQFKEMVMADLRNAMVGGALRRIAAQEIGPGLITTGCDVGQVALARCLHGEDAYVSTELDLTADVTRQTITQDDFFKTLFSGADGLRKNASAGALSMSVGMALGNRKSLTVCTIGGELVVDGEFFESLCFASAHSLPLAIVIWNNDGTHSNGNLIKQLSGFGGSVRGSRTLLVEAVKGYDYPALCHVMEEQISRSRSGVTTLTLVESGQDDVKAMTQWVEEKQIASAEQIKELSDSCMKEVDRSRKAAYYSSLVADTPLLTPQPQLLDLSDVKLPTTTSVMQLPFMPEVVNKAVGIARRGHIAVAEVRGCSLDGNLMSSYPEAHVVLRSTSISAGYALAMTAENVAVLTPCSYLETIAAYKELLSTTCQSVVVETGDFSKIEQDSVPVSVWEARQISQGEDLTMVTFGSTTRAAEDAVRMMSSHNIMADHIHLPAVRPMDPTDMILKSIRKTKRLLVVDPDISSRAARYVVSELATREGGLRHLLAAPVVASPSVGKPQIEPQDICKAAGNAVR